MSMLNPKSLWKVYLIKYDWKREWQNSYEWRAPTLVEAEAFIGIHCLWWHLSIDAVYDGVHYSGENIVSKEVSNKQMIKILATHKKYEIGQQPQYKDKIKTARDLLIKQFKT